MNTISNNEPKSNGTGPLPKLPDNPPDARTGLDYWRELMFHMANKRHDENGRRDTSRTGRLP